MPDEIEGIPVMPEQPVITVPVKTYYVEGGTKYRKTVFPGGGVIIEAIGDENAEEVDYVPVPMPEPGPTAEDRIAELEARNLALQAEMEAKDRENKLALFEIYNMLMGGE